MVKTISQKIFGRKFSTGEWILSITSLSAGAITILQNVNLGTLSAGIEQSVTKSPTNFWMLFLGVLLVLVIVFLVRRKK